jgi:hypothetical protein
MRVELDPSQGFSRSERLATPGAAARADRHAEGAASTDRQQLDAMDLASSAQAGARERRRAPRAKGF